MMSDVMKMNKHTHICKDNCLQISTQCKSTPVLCVLWHHRPSITFTLHGLQHVDLPSLPAALFQIRHLSAGTNLGSFAESDTWPDPDETCGGELPSIIWISVILRSRWWMAAVVDLQVAEYGTARWLQLRERNGVKLLLLICLQLMLSHWNDCVNFIYSFLYIFFSFLSLLLLFRTLWGETFFMQENYISDG